MGKHFNSKHDDAAWRALFGRWHAGEDSRALRAEAGVSGDTWSANAKRLGMRIGDLPEGHPAKRGAPAFADRADDWRHPNSRLTEGEWRALFALRAAGTPDTVLVVKFGVKAATICSQAEARGIRRADLRAGVRTPPALRCAAGHLPTEWGGDVRALPAQSAPLEEAVIDPDDPEGTRAAFKAAIREAGRREDYQRIQAVCGAQNAMEKAFFAKAGAGGEAARAVGPLHHPAGGPVVGSHALLPPPPMGEDRELILRPQQRPPEGDWSTWLFLGGRGAGKTLAGAS